uniref:restriction endonuclease subunit S n=1 Tax=Catenibacillus scindens TaxID=673271 RepID=UPI0032096E2D
MENVKLCDVIRRANIKVDKDNTDLVYYVGGEHIESENIRVSNRGLIAGSTIGPMFYYGFKSGDFLLVSRNPHLRKAGLVDFDGICSEKTFVLETADPKKLIPQFLPFILQNERFWKYAYQNRHGSTNTFINWSTLANYRFELPDPDTQRNLATVLWSINDTIEAYRKLIAATDELVKSQFLGLFGDPVTNEKGYMIRPFSDFASIDAQMTTDYKKYADYPHIGIDSIEKDTGKLSGYRTVAEDNVKSGKYLFTKEHIIYSKIRPNLNKVALPTFCGLCSADSYPILPNNEMCNREYLAYVLRSQWFLAYIVPLSGRSNMPKVNREQINGFSWPLPPLDEQEQFAVFIRQSDKSKFELEKALSELTATYKRILAENLG